MANAVWPASLPQEFLAPGELETEPDAALRTEMDAPVPKTRRRFTAAVAPIRGDLRVTPAQRDTLRQFYRQTLGFGALPFDWARTTVGVTEVYLFVSPPTFRPTQRGVRYIASLQLEIQP